MPIVPDDLATLDIVAAIFHDLPPKDPRARDPQPTLSEAVTPLNDGGRQHIRAKFVETLRSTKAYPVQFVDPLPASSIGTSLTEYLVAEYDVADFVRRSRSYGESLFQLQDSTMSAGLLCVIACTIQDMPSVGLMKIEREEGAQLELGGNEGRRTFTFEMLENLVFTKNTKLFKAALFARLGPDADAICSLASDNQLGAMAQYWLDFVGCEKEREARVDTQAFYNLIVHEVNHAADLTPVQKHDTYEALLTEMRSARRAVNIHQFISDHVPPAIQGIIRDRLRDTGLPRHFDKDTADIAPAMKRKILYTESDIKVVVPVNSERLVTVTRRSVTVNDPVTRVGREQ